MVVCASGARGARALRSLADLHLVPSVPAGFSAPPQLQKVVRPADHFPLRLTDLPHESWALGRGGITPTRGDRPWHARRTTTSSRSPPPSWSANRATPSRRPLRTWASTRARSALGPESTPRRRHHRPPMP